MEKISGISNTPKSSNNQKGNSYYSANTKKTKDVVIDSLEYKKVLNSALEARSIAKNKDVNKFKSLIEKAEGKLTGQLKVAPLKDDAYVRESTMMMANGGLAAKERIERKSIEELSKKPVEKKVISSYSTAYGQYRRDLEYVNPSYKSYEDLSKEARGYKNNYINNKKNKKDIDFDEFENNISFEEQTKKVSFWSKFKNAIKNFFKTEEEESTKTTSIHPRVDKAEQYRKSVPKAAPQINKEEMERKRLQNIREMAIKAR